MGWWWWVYYPDYVLSLTSLPHSWWLEWQLTRPPPLTDAESDLVSTLFCPSCQCSSCLYSLCLAPLRSSLLLDLALTERRPTTKSTHRPTLTRREPLNPASFVRSCLFSSGASQLVCLVRPNLTARLMYRERKVLPQLFSLRFVLGSSISACPWNTCVQCLFTFSRLLFFANFCSGWTRFFLRTSDWPQFWAQNLNNQAKLRLCNRDWVWVLQSLGCIPSICHFLCYHADGSK